MNSINRHGRPEPNFTLDTKRTLERIGRLGSSTYGLRRADIILRVCRWVLPYERALRRQQTRAADRSLQSSLRAAIELLVDNRVGHLIGEVNPGTAADRSLSIPKRIIGESETR